jgi:uncharacterized protein YndB with AHSA1/START domain
MPISRFLIRCFVALLLAAPAAPLAAEPSWRDFPGVSNTSFVEPNGHRAIQLSIDVPAEPQAAFDAFATAEGFRSWAVPVAQIDLRTGGIIESSYGPAARLGSRDNIRNEILAYVPGRLLVIRNVQAPRSFVHPELFQRTVTVIEFAPAGPGRARVTITNTGYGAGEGFDRLYRQFEWGDAFSLASLRRRFEQGPVDWSQGEPQAAAVAATERVEGRLQTGEVRGFGVLVEERARGRSCAPAWRAHRGRGRGRPRRRGNCRSHSRRNKRDRRS